MHFSSILKHYASGKIAKCYALCSLVALCASCIPQRSIVLLQDKDNDGQTTFAAVENITNQYILQPNDYLYINVSLSDPKLALPFNPIQTMPQNGSSAQNYRYFNYMINDSMQINFPITGPIDLSGCTLQMAHERISQAISKKYLKGFYLTVKLASNSFSVLGEVNRQGLYTMERDQITIFEALAQAGGFSSYAKRKEVKLLRKGADGVITEHVLDLTNDAIVNSNLYYVYPNDVIYVRPVPAKMLGFGETFSTSIISAFSSLITLYLLILSL